MNKIQKRALKKKKRIEKEQKAMPKLKKQKIKASLDDVSLGSINPRVIGNRESSEVLQKQMDELKNKMDVLDKLFGRKNNY